MTNRFLAGVTTLGCLLVCSISTAEPGSESAPDRAPVHDKSERGTVFHIATGIGIPEVVNLEAGYHPIPSLSIDASIGVVIFNLLAGLGVTYQIRFSDGALREYFTASVRARLNVADEPLKLRSRGERLGATVDVLAGYKVAAASGLFGRVQLGALMYDDAGLAAGPLIGASVGWDF